MLRKQSTASKLPDTSYIKQMEVTRDFLGPGALPDGRFINSDAFLQCGGEADMGQRERGVRRKVDFPGGHTETESAPCSCLLSCSRDEPLQCGRSGLFTQPSLPQEKCVGLWKRKTHFSSTSICLCLPQARQEPHTDLGSLVPQDIAQVPALLKAATFALVLPGTGHMGFSVRKIALRFFCHW